VKTIWLIPPVVTSQISREDPERSILACPLASARLRIGVAALEWKRCGNENVFWDPGSAAGGKRVDWTSLQICVVPKFFYDSPLRPWLDACLVAKSHGCRLVADICDYPFRKPAPVPEFYSALLPDCDAVVVNSERMGELMAPHVARRPLLIEDAILGTISEPAFTPGARVELLWFGHPVNFPYLRSRLGDLARLAARKPCRLTVLTQEESGIRQWTENIPRTLASGLEARFIPWSLEAMPIALGECDLVILPSDPADPLKAGASANRLAEALNAGRFPVASPLPSYLPFSEVAWVGQDLVEGIEWALANPGEVLARIRRGQVMVAERFSAATVGGRWRELFQRLLDSRDSQP
jgi:glycosyltransferase involved in cell wall biosynthesis